MAFPTMTMPGAGLWTRLTKPVTEYMTHRVSMRVTKTLTISSVASVSVPDFIEIDEKQAVCIIGYMPSACYSCKCSSIITLFVIESAIATTIFLICSRNIF